MSSITLEYDIMLPAALLFWSLMGNTLPYFEVCEVISAGEREKFSLLWGFLQGAEVSVCLSGSVWWQSKV